MPPAVLPAAILIGVLCPRRIGNGESYYRLYDPSEAVPSALRGSSQCPQRQFPVVSIPYYGIYNQDYIDYGIVRPIGAIRTLVLRSRIPAIQRELTYSLRRTAQTAGYQPIAWLCHTVQRQKPVPAQDQTRWNRRQSGKTTPKAPHLLLALLVALPLCSLLCRGILPNRSWGTI